MALVKQLKLLVTLFSLVATSVVAVSPKAAEEEDDTPLPLVIWHGTFYSQALLVSI
jgi:hypothetical protein